MPANCFLEISNVFSTLTLRSSLLQPFIGIRRIGNLAPERLVDLAPNVHHHGTKNLEAKIIVPAFLDCRDQRSKVVVDVLSGEEAAVKVWLICLCVEASVRHHVAQISEHVEGRVTPHDSC